MDKRELVFHKAFTLLPKYGGLAWGAVNQACLLLGEVVSKSLVEEFEEWVERRESLEAFTEDVLMPTRTTRRDTFPLRDRMELTRGDEVLVDVSDYTRTDESDEQWAMVVSFAPGSASVYPIKAQMHRRGVGQFTAREVLAWRRPLSLHRAFRDVVHETYIRLGEPDPLFKSDESAARSLI